jgi:UDP-N-acetylmuramoyl-L-alanyl-D-glutamate--2,6-diaminopimelate ligase
MAISGVVFDDREAVPGSLFCCLPGARRDGHDFAGLAAAAGAVAFICEHTLGAEVGDALQLVVPPGTARIAMARAACAFYGDPASALHTVGITGTNGKTTTTYLLQSILERAGWPTGVIGTLDGARTTPESPHLQRSLAEMRGAGMAASVMEVSSHALVQHRVDGIRFDVAVRTSRGTTSTTTKRSRRTSRPKRGCSPRNGPVSPSSTATTSSAGVFSTAPRSRRSRSHSTTCVISSWA